MRWPVLIVVLALGQCVGSSTTHDLTPVTTAAIGIRAEPVALYAADPNRSRLGALTYIGGWKLTSDNAGFGGLSSLAVEGNKVIALSDARGLVRFRVGRFGHISDAVIEAVPAGCGGGRAKTGHDSESLAHDPWSGKWWIGFEWRNVICRTNDDLSIGERVYQPREMADWSRTKGAETILRLKGGRFLVVSEGSQGAARVRPVIMFGGDPTDAKTPHVTLGYLPPSGFSPTDATELPDGRILVLNRSFGLASLFTACLTVIDPKTIRAGAVIQGPIIARFEAPAISENFEGIASGTEDGQTIVWLVSDDNFLSWQRTLLLKFALTGARP